LGGPYIAVHFRRRDYLYARGDKIPSLKWAAEQLKKRLEEFKLKSVFVATDAPQAEFVELQNHLEGFDVYRFTPTKEVHQRYKDGGVAIIDQIICSHARSDFPILFFSQ
jgi:peptide-O-fucosyltransferase